MRGSPSSGDSTLSRQAPVFLGVVCWCGAVKAFQGRVESRSVLSVCHSDFWFFTASTASTLPNSIISSSRPCTHAMSEADTSPPATKQEKVATAVAPPTAAAQPSTDQSPNDDHIPSPKFVLTEKALDDALNDMWANNANAISHCYSNTDALKVDFTRTGKRSFFGMISELLPLLL